MIDCRSASSGSNDADIRVMAFRDACSLVRQSASDELDSPAYQLAGVADLLCGSLTSQSGARQHLWMH